MSKAKPTIEAAKAVIKRDTRKAKTEPSSERKQGAIVDRHIRSHTPERLYGPKDK